MGDVICLDCFAKFNTIVWGQGIVTDGCCPACTNTKGFKYLKE